MLMPFGPFNGRPVEDLPDYYLFILIERRLWPDLAAAVNLELERRSAERRRLMKKAA